MKRIVMISVGILLALLFLPVLLAQFRSQERRELIGLRLKDVDYRNVSFLNREQDLNLAGMLFVPDGDGPFPGAVIIHGSGPSFRDNRWYLTLAEYLRKSGIAVLLPDKRGCEESEGDWTVASFEDLAGDTLAALDFLNRQKEVPIAYAGVVGMSQGGIIAPLVASRGRDLAFVVNVVGGSVPIHQSLIYEENHNIRQIGVLPGFSNLIAYPAAWSLIYARQKEFWDAVGNFDPLPYWRELDVPSLVLYGEEDTNVPSNKSARLLRNLENPFITVMIYPGSGHALESPEGEGKSIFREEALAETAEFINKAGKLD